MANEAECIARTTTHSSWLRPLKSNYSWIDNERMRVPETRKSQRKINAGFNESAREFCEIVNGPTIGLVTVIFLMLAAGKPSY
jgi:hypothetical protein